MISLRKAGPSLLALALTAVLCNPNVAAAHRIGHHHDHDRQLQGSGFCSTVSPPTEMMTEVEATLAEYHDKYGSFKKPEQSININIYWHSINDNTGNNGITTQQITDSVAYLNTEFAGTDFTFTLVSTSQTDSTTYFYAAENSQAEIDMKAALHQGDNSDLNVYSIGISDVSGTVGYARFPWFYLSDPTRDGVVIDRKVAKGGGFANLDEGDILVHEVGHWLGLYHVFEGNDCFSATGDYVDDTPAQDTASSGCPVTQDSCTGQAGSDSFNNYMDESDNTCTMEFTAGQITRMSETYQVYRKVATPAPTNAPTPTPAPIAGATPFPTAKPTPCSIFFGDESISDVWARFQCTAFSFNC